MYYTYTCAYIHIYIYMIVYVYAYVHAFVYIYIYYIHIYRASARVLHPRTFPLASVAFILYLNLLNSGIGMGLIS